MFEAARGKIQLKVEGKKVLWLDLKKFKNSLQDEVIHISFHAMKSDELTTLSVEVEFSGKAKGQFDGGIIKENIHEITVKGYHRPSR